MSSKAFTLIELLAVIVILAIISLIATPIVLNIINDSKKSSNEESIKMYGKAIENAAGNYFLKHPENKKVTVQKLKNENLVNYNGNPVECEIEKIYQSGKIYLKDCTINGEKVDYTYGEESYKDYIHLVEDAEPKGLSPGDKYTYDVNDNDTFTFYILSIEENQVNLIMDRNICNDGKTATAGNPCTIAWYLYSGSNNYGPITAIKGVYNATKNWINVPNMNIYYSDEGRKYAEDNGYANIYGYGRLESTVLGIRIIDGTGVELTREKNQTPAILYEEGKVLKARLPKLSEAIDLGCSSNYQSGTCKSLLVENLDDASSWCSNCSINYSNTHKISGIYGYWLMTSFSDNSYQSSYIEYAGRIYQEYTSKINAIGIRPVITIPISNF